VAYVTNISIFLPNGPTNRLLDAYRILVAIELALKDAGFTAGNTGHDIPSLLGQAATQHPLLASQLNTHQAKLRADLVQITCNNKFNQPVAVQSTNYPHSRYTRFIGDWGGVSETPQTSIDRLFQTCNNLLWHLKMHRSTLGIQL
jgi:hypothetical protein